MQLFGLKVIRSSKPTSTPGGVRVAHVIYIPLPPDAWRPRPSGKAGQLDTLAVAADPTGQGPDVTWMVHRPDLHGEGSHNSSERIDEE